MRVKKVFKITGFILLTLLLILLVLAGYMYYQYKGKYPENKDKYPHKIGYINPENTLNATGFTICDDKKMLGYYSSAAPYIYRDNKLVFKQKIIDNYKNNEYQDTGYLNLRFLINCEGKVGHVEVNEFDIDLIRSDLTDELVDQLIKLALKEDNWEIRNKHYDTPQNHYMYLLFKLENGNVTEILP